MSYQDNGCPKCTEERMCDSCYIEKVEWDIVSSQHEMNNLQESICDFDNAISFWDLQVKTAMNRVEHFKRLKNANIGSKAVNSS